MTRKWGNEVFDVCDNLAFFFFFSSNLIIFIAKEKIYELLIFRMNLPREDIISFRIKYEMMVFETLHLFHFKYLCFHGNVYYFSHHRRTSQKAFVFCVK